MNIAKIITIIFMVSLAGCEQENNYPNRYFDYSGNDGCTPANIGHRLGGDLINFEDNTLEGIKGISIQQDSECFKNWEFDLTESLDTIVLSHEILFNNIPLVETSSELLKSIPTIDDVLSEFLLIEVSKPVIIDLKYLARNESLNQAKALAIEIRSAHNIDVWFTVSKSNTQVLNSICSVIAGEFDIMLYDLGGSYCE